uniref:Uncharacterized protein n=1 Tax=Caulobacter phage BL57 TaxID=3348355 RepID=A0AB74UNI1_9VIRU
MAEHMIASFADAEQIADLERRLREANDALADYAQEKKADLETIRRLEARVRQDEAYENEVAKLLTAAGAPVAVMPIERVKWAARRLVEDRPISDKRVALILQIIQNARDDFQDRESWFPMVANRFKDIEAALAAGTVIGRDDGPTTPRARSPTTAAPTTSSTRGSTQAMTAAGACVRKSSSPRSSRRSRSRSPSRPSRRRR